MNTKCEVVTVILHSSDEITHWFVYMNIHFHNSASPNYLISHINLHFFPWFHLCKAQKVGKFYIERGENQLGFLRIEGSEKRMNEWRSYRVGMASAISTKNKFILTYLKYFLLSFYTCFLKNKLFCPCLINDTKYAKFQSLKCI